MLYTVNLLEKNVKRLETIKNSLQKYIDGETVKYDFNTLFFNMKDVLTNIYYVLTESYYYNYNNCSHYCFQMQPMLEQLFNLDTIENEANAKQAMNCINMVQHILGEEDIERLSKLTSAYCRGDFNEFLTIHGSNLEFSNHEICRFVDSIQNKNNKQLNILNYNNSNKYMLDEMYNMFQQKMYSVCVDSWCSYRETKRDYFHKIILGGAGRCTITNNAFDVTIATIPIQQDIHNPNVVNTYDYEYITKVVSYTAPDGILLLIMPTSRLTKGTCTFIAKYMRDVEIYTKRGSDFNNICIITGYKRAADFELDIDIFNKLRYYKILYPAYKQIEWTGLEREFILPEHRTKLKYFRGSLISDEDINEMFDNSDAIKEFWSEQKPALLSDYHKRPLLPFNIGHLGLVLTSGCLDGLVQEDENHSHLVKGRIVKHKNKEEFQLDNGLGVTVEETTSNQVEINLFLQDGTYKSLV